MSTASPAASSAPEEKTRTNPTDADGPRSPLETFVFDRITEAQSALWRAELMRRVLTAAIALMTILLAWWIVDQWIWSPPVLARTMVVAGVLAAASLYAVKRLWPIVHYRITEDYAARSLERDHPELGHSLSSYVGLKRQSPAAGLADRVVQSVGAEAAKKLRAIEGPPSEATGLASWWAATIGLIAMLAVYSAASPKSIVQSTARIFQPLAALDAPQRVQISDVQPGDAEVLAGRNLMISATVTNLRDQEPIKLVWGSGFETTQADKTKETATGNDATFTADLDGPRDRFTTSISIPHQASGIQRYRIEAGDASAGPFELTIRDTPVVRVAEVNYQPPAYTGQKPRTRRTGSISGVDGTRVRVVAETNRPITRAVLELNPRLVGQEVRATAGASEMKLATDGRSAEHEFVLRAQTGNGSIVLEDYRIRIWDDADQNNTDPVIHPIEISKDLPPEVRIVVPQTSPRDVPIDAQQVFEIHASDVDFGLAQVEIEVRRGIDVIARSTVWQAPDAQASTTGSPGVLGNQVIEYRFRPSRMIVARGRNRGLHGGDRHGGGRNSGGPNGGGLNVGDEVEVTAIATDNRHDDSDPLIVPGVTQTSPITLRIVAGSDNQTDQQPSPDKSRSKEDQTGQPTEQGEGDAPQGQQGGGSGEAGKSQKGEGQNGEQQSGKGQQGEDQTGKPPEAGNEIGEDAGSDSQPSDSQPSDSQPSQGESSGGGQSDGDQSDMPDAADPNEGQDPSDANNDSDQASKGGQSPNQTAPNQGGESQGNQPPSPPQDDAEAFERIKDYLDNKNNQQDSNPNQNSNPNSEGQNQPSEPNQSNKNPQPEGDSRTEGGQGQSDQRPPSQGDQPRGDQSQEGMNDPAEGGEQNNDPTQPDGQGQSGKPPTEPEEASRQETGQQETGQQGSESEDASKQSDGDPGAQDGQQSSSGQPSEAGQQVKPSDGQDAGGEGQDASQEGTSGDQETSGDQKSGSDQTGDGDQSAMGEESGNSDQRAQGKENGSEAGPQDGPQNPEGQPDNQSSEPESSDSGSSDSGSSDSGSSDSGSSDSGSSDSGKREASGTSQPSDPSQPSGKSDDSPGDSQSSDPSDSSGAPQSDNSPTDPNRSDASPSDSSSNGGSGSSGGGIGTDSGEDETELPDPVDLEYTKKATDMVLDYLDETRQAPDPELLDRLKWTEQDLQRFRDRWKDLPAQNQESSSNTELTEDMREALQSLGLRPPGGTRGQQSDRADGLKGLRDSGNRRQAPPAIRDAFEAFRRGLARPNQ